MSYLRLASFNVLLALLVVAALPGLAAAEMPRSETAPSSEKPVDDGPSCGGSRAAWPGPDGFGVTGATCTYAWVDITGAGTQVDLGDDAFGGPFAVGFAFPLYGVMHTEFYVSSNGFLSFGAGSSDYGNDCPLPDANTPDNIIALMWDDMDPEDNLDPVYYQSFGAGACPWSGYAGACLVVEYYGYSHYDSNGAVNDSAGTWEAILLDDGAVIMQYQDGGAEEGSGATTGIEGADQPADHGLTYACDTASSITDSLCIEYTQPNQWLDLSPDALTVSGCVGAAQIHGFDLYNHTGADGAFALTYTVTSANGTLTGPGSLFVADGATEGFNVELTPDPGLSSGDQVIATVEANGNGYNDISDITKTVYEATTGWASFTDTPAGSRYHGVAYHDGYLYQIGGETNWWTATGAVQVYDVAGDSWSGGAAMPTPVYGIDAAVIGDGVYVVGGTDCTDDPHNGCDAGAFYGTVQILDTATGVWSTDATDPLPVTLAYASAVSHGGKLYVIGGMDDAGAPVNTMYVYDPAAGNGARWVTGTAMTTVRAYAGAAVIGDSIYVAGGWQGGTAVTYGMEVYDITGDSWSAGPDMLTIGDPPYTGWAPFGDGVLGHQYFVVYNGGPVEFDGTDTTYSCGANGQAYDTVGGAWSHLPDLPRCLYGSQGDGDGAALWDVSGRTNEGGWHMALENQVTEPCGAGGEIFSDGFESGDTSAWSNAVP